MSVKGKHIIVHVIKGILVLLMVQILLLSSLILALRLPFVQTWLLSRLTHTLELRYDLSVEVEDVYMQWLDLLRFNGVSISDGDTEILYSQEFYIDLNLHPRNIARGLWEIESVYLNGVTLHGIRPVDSESFYGLRKLERADTLGKKTTPLDIAFNINQISVNDINFILADSLEGQYGSIYLEEGILGVKKFNISDRDLVLDEVIFTHLNVELNEKKDVSYTIEKVATEALQEEDLPVEYLPETHWNISMDHFKIVNSRFSYSSDSQKRVHFNSSNFIVDSIDLVFEDFKYAGDSLSVIPGNLSFVLDDRIEVHKFQGEKLKLSTTTAVVENLLIRTGASQIAGDIFLEYPSLLAFKDFTNSVNFNIDFETGEMNINELAYFLPEIRKNALLKEGSYTDISIQADLKGTLNSLTAVNLNLYLTPSVFLQGRLSLKHVTDKQPLVLDFDLYRSTINLKHLHRLFPGFDPPENFYKLGTVNFTGSYNGTVKDFSATGKLDTDLGSGEIDLQMHLFSKNNANYTGNIRISDFDLGTWTDIKDLGTVTLQTQVVEGSGLVKENIHILAETEIQKLEYLGYSYENIIMDGLLDNEVFIGDLFIDDENLELELEGIVDFSSQIPKLNAKAAIDYANLQALNITKRKIILHTNLNAGIGSYTPDSLSGEIIFRNISVTIDTTLLETEYLSIHASAHEENKQEINLETPFLAGNLAGQFNVTTIIPQVNRFLRKKYPAWSQLMNIDTLSKHFDPTEVSFALTAGDLSPWVIGTADTLKNIDLEGSFSNLDDSYHSKLSVGKFTTGNTTLKDLFFYIDGYNSRSNFIVSSDTVISGNLQIANANLFGDVAGDSLYFTAALLEDFSVLEDFNIEGIVSTDGEDMYGRILPGALTVLQEEWRVMPDNSFSVEDGELWIENMLFSHEGQTVSLSKNRKEDFSARFRDFDINFLNNLLHIPAIEFGGELNGRVNIPSLNNPEDIAIDLNIPEFYMNKDNYGELEILAARDYKTDKLLITGNLREGEQWLEIDGWFNPKAEIREEQFSLEIDINDYPMIIGEYFIGDQISNTKGTVDADVHLIPTEAGVQLLGEAVVNAASTTLDIVGVKLYMDGDTVFFRENFFDFSQVTLEDEDGNEADMEGGFYHFDLKRFGYNANILSEYFTLIDLKKAPELIYYGTVYGPMTIDITGDFEQPDIHIDAETGSDSRFFIKTDYTETTTDVQFVNFVTEEELEQKDWVKGSGLKLVVDMIATEDVEAQIIFDERTGDILKGRGFGDLQLNLDRSGEITLLGLYRITEGNYLFTLPAVRKPFSIISGSTVEWTGDPLNARLDIEAKYEGLKAAPLNLISEFLVTSDERTAASRSTDIDLIMYIEGRLLTPDIYFDLEFPNITGQLRTYIDNKLQLLEADQNEMNRQVVSLITLRGFLPSNTAVQSGYVARALLYNTGTEYLGNIVSLYLTDIMTTAVSEVDFISGIDFDLSYLVPTGDIIETGNLDPSKSEFQVRFRNRLFDDRFIVDVGGNFVNNSAYSRGSYVAGNLIFEYVLTKDRRLRMRVYTIGDQVPEGRRIKYGAGITYRREFDSFSSWLKGIENDAESMDSSAN